MSRDLRITGLSAGYGDRRIVSDLELSPWPAGGVTALVGPNGAGKSTLLRAVAGLIPSQGAVRMGDTALDGLSVAARARHVAYMPQALPQDVALTVLETVIAAWEASPSARSADLNVVSPAERAMRALEQVDAAHLALKRLDRLSGGQRQMAGLAQAMVRQPRVLLLDEPTSALDLRHQLQVFALARDYARRHDAVVAMVLHDLQAAATVSDHMVVLADGTVRAEGSASRALTTDILRQVWQVHARIEDGGAAGLRLVVDGLA